MFLTAARTIAELSPAKRDPRANLLPPLAELRKISLRVAIAVATRAEAEGLAHPVPDRDLAAAVRSMMWEPLYATYRRLRKPS
jgi:malate dehydrogenase (oxaloacetate-decarboxylating)